MEKREEESADTEDGDLVEEEEGESSEYGRQGEVVEEGGVKES